MTVKETGGSAFPQYGNDPWGKPSTHAAGMTLRDYFAGQAINGMLSDPNCDPTPKTIAALAISAYTIADAMLEARK